MEIIERKELFDQIIECKQVVDEYGLTYGEEADFCHIKIRVMGQDIKKHSWSKYGGPSGVDYGIKCPVCGSFIVIDSKEIPKRIQQTAEEVKLNG